MGQSVERLNKFAKGDIVIVKFPYTNFKKFKLRPDLIISNQKVNMTGDYMLMQITSKFNDDQLSLLIEENMFLANKVLPLKSYLRLHKIFTVNEDLIQKKYTKLTDSSITLVHQKFNELIS